MALIIACCSLVVLLTVERVIILGQYRRKVIERNFDEYRRLPSAARMFFDSTWRRWPENETFFGELVVTTITFGNSPAIGTIIEVVVVNNNLEGPVHMVGHLNPGASVNAGDRISITLGDLDMNAFVTATKVYWPEGVQSVSVELKGSAINRKTVVKSEAWQERWLGHKKQ